MATTVPHCDPSLDGLDNRVTQCDRQLGSSDLASVTLCQTVVHPFTSSTATNGRYISHEWAIYLNCVANLA